MSASALPAPVVSRGAFGGHQVSISAGSKTYNVVVVGSHVSATVEYESKPANWRCRRPFVTVRRDVRAGPTLARISAQAQAAIAEALEATS